MRSEAEVRRALELSRTMAKSSNKLAAATATLVAESLAWVLGQQSMVTEVIDRTDKVDRAIKRAGRQ